MSLPIEHPPSEGEHPIPLAWRPVIRAICQSLVDGDYTLRSGIPGVVPLSDDDAAQTRDYLQDYGETLVSLPEETWDSSVCSWQGPGRWDALVDLWTQAEGRSDLVLHLCVSEVVGGLEFRVHMVYVP